SDVCSSDLPGRWLLSEDTGDGSGESLRPRQERLSRPERLDNVRLDFQLHPKAGGDIRLYTLRQQQDLATTGFTVIDQNQGLHVMHSGIAFTIALPASLLDQPTGSELDPAIGLGIGHQPRIPLAQLVGQHRRYQRIFEETASIAQHLRIGPFLAANGTHRLTDIAGCRLFHTHLLETLTQRAIFQPQARCALQRETHPQDDETPALLLEQTVAISEGASRCIKFTKLARGAIKCGQTGENITDLHSIGADILDRRSSNGSGNQAQILQPRQAQLQTMQYKGVPWLTGLSLKHHLLAIVGQQPNAPAVQAQHQRLNVLGQQKVTAPAEHAQGQAQTLRSRQRLAHLVVVMGFGEVARTSINSER